jgi:hypothetical protein
MIAAWLELGAIRIEIASGTLLFRGLPGQENLS